MPKEKEYLSLIPSIYKQNYEDIGMFFFVEAQRSIVPAITIEQGIYNYFKFCRLEDFNIDSAKTTYMRMKHKHYEEQRT